MRCGTWLLPILMLAIGGLALSESEPAGLVLQYFVLLNCGCVVV